AMRHPLTPDPVDSPDSSSAWPSSLEPLLRHPRQVQRNLAARPLEGVFVHVRLAVLGPLQEVGDDPQAGFQEFQFSGLGAAVINSRLLAKDGGVGSWTGDLEAVTLNLLQVVRADLRAAP